MMAGVLGFSQSRFRGPDGSRRGIWTAETELLTRVRRLGFEESSVMRSNVYPTAVNVEMQSQFSREHIRRLGRSFGSG